MPKVAGLWLTGVRVEVQIAKPSYSKKCDGCDEVPKNQRLHVRIGMGRGQKTEVYCQTCGKAWFNDHERELERAKLKLETGEGSIRRSK